MDGNQRGPDAAAMRTAVRVTALTAALLIGIAVGRYAEPPAQAEKPGPDTAKTTPPPVVQIIEPPDASLQPAPPLELWDAYDWTSTPLLPTAGLDAGTQWEIFETVCGKDPDAFCALMAIAKHETDFRADLAGDNGGSLGMFQINTKWHTDRMERLSVTDLTNPVQCAKVALDYLQELARITGFGFSDHGIYMAYNMGPSGARKAQAAGRDTTAYSEAVLAYYRGYMMELEWAADE